MKLRLSLLLLLSSSLVVIGAAEHEVEIQDLWGNVDMEAGEKKSVVCTVYNPKDDDVIVWTIGDKELTSKKDIVYDRVEDSMRQKLILKAEIWMDKKVFSCSCRGKSETFIVSVHKADFPTKVILDKVSEGENLTLQVGVSLYPPPEEVFWEVVKPDGSTVTRLVPGENSMYGEYVAEQPQVLGEDGANYIYRMLIGYVNREEAENNHFLHIKHLGKQYDVEFSLSVQLKETDSETVVTVSTPGLQPTPKTETTALGWGVWIILIVITLLVVLIVLFIVYRRKTKKAEAVETKKVAYTEVNQKDPEHV